MVSWFSKLPKRRDVDLVLSSTLFQSLRQWIDRKRSNRGEERSPGNFARLRSFRNSVRFSRYRNFVRCLYGFMILETSETQGCWKYIVKYSVSIVTPTNRKRPNREERKMIDGWSPALRDETFIRCNLRDWLDRIATERRVKGTNSE